MLKICARTRECGIYVTASDVDTRKIICAAPWGICIRRAFRSVKPKPAVIIDVN